MLTLPTLFKVPEAEYRIDHAAAAELQLKEE